MDGYATSTIAALFYAKPDKVVFADLVAELASALLHAPDGGLDIHTAYEDFVIFDLADMRICLAYSDLTTEFAEPSRRHGTSEAVIVSVGDRPDMPAGRDRTEMCETLSARIETRAPADGMVVADSDVAFTEEAFDSLLEDLLAVYWSRPELDAEAEADTPEEIILPDEVVEALFAPQQIYGTPANEELPPDVIPVPAQPARLLQPPKRKRAKLFDPFKPRDLSDDLAERFDREIAARDAARDAPRPSATPHRSPGPTTFPSTTYGEPRPPAPPRTNRASAAFGRLRQQHGDDALAGEGVDFLFPETETARAQPLVHRGAIHAINVAMMAFSLPMGAFLLTLALLGRESLVMSARMTAVTGAGMGIAQNDSVSSLILSLI